MKRHYRQYLPLFPTAVEQFDFERFDLVLSVSHCCVKSVLGAARPAYLLLPDARCATPGISSTPISDLSDGPLSSELMRPIMARTGPLGPGYRGRVDRYVAISHHVAGRIGRYYNREATVVYPPVDTAFFHPERSEPERYALVVSALVPYKRIELAIEACRRAGCR